MTVQLTDLMELAADVQITSIGELPPSMRNGLPDYEDGFTVSRPLARKRSRVVDALGAELLEAFREPTRLVDVVLQLSKAHQVDPHELLEEALPLVVQSIADDVLVEQGHEAPPALTPTLEPGARIGVATVLRPMYLLEDTELYEGAAEEGARVAIKVYRTPVGRLQSLMYERELSVLRHLDGAIAPALLDHGEADGRLFLIEEWCAGGSLAAAMRERNELRDLAELAASVAECYHSLHEAGVRHGDVHPGNIIIGADGAVSLVDFGQASLDGDAPPRGGVIGYYEPELARAELAGDASPAPSRAGEQYALAAVLYESIVGHQFLELPLGRTAALEAIVADEPRRFVEHGRGNLTPLEGPLRRALSKDPADRYPTLDAFAQDLRAAVAATPAAILPPNPLRGRFDSLGLTSLESAQLGDVRPTASVFYGAAGIGVGLLSAAQAMDDPELAAMSHLWVDLALTADEESGYTNPEYGMGRDMLYHGSPYHGLAGAYLARALVADAQCDQVSLGDAIATYLELTKEPLTGFDPSLEGPAALAGLNQLRTLRSLTPPMAARLHEESARMESEVVAALRSRPRISHDVGAALGVAHGYAGNLRNLLAAASLSASQPDEHVLERLDELASLAHGMGGGLRWPWFVTDRGDLGRSMSGWCNGSAGMVLLWGEALEHWDSSQARELALGAAEDVYFDASSIGNICCGLAGRGLALQALYRKTGDERQRSRSIELVERSVGVASHDSALQSELAEVRASLFKGELGPAVAATVLERPDHLTLPLV